MMKTNATKQSLRKFVRQELKPLLIIALVMFAMRSALADWNDVPSGSMKPSILVGDRVFVNKLAYDLKVPFTTWHLAQWDNPKRGDIVVFFSPADGKRLVKRVVGLPGDRIELANNHLLVNGTPVEYNPLSQKTIAGLSPAEQPPHEYATEELPGHPHPVMTTPAVPARRNFGPVLVPTGQYFMMGDNRDDSFDSRYFGCVERGEIVGRATAVIFSLDHEAYYLPRWHRFGTSLP